MILALCAAHGAAAPPDDRESRLREAVWGGRWLEGVRLYAELEGASAAPSPQASYLDGFVLWKLRRLENARAPLKKAAKAGFRAGPERLQPDELLANIGAYLELRPPRANVPRLDGSFIAVYSDTLPGSPVLGALTRFPEIGRGIFGALPTVRSFLFDRLPRFGASTGCSRGPILPLPHELLPRRGCRVHRLPALRAAAWAGTSASVHPGSPCGRAVGRRASGPRP